MELRHLKYFIAVAEELHFGRAAERLHVAQPAVSDQIRKLENELGVRLLNRNPRRVSLTDAGTALLREARPVLHQAEVARVAARNAHDRSTISLRIGYMATCLPASVPRAVQRLAGSMPHLDTRLEPGTALSLLDALRAGRLDAAIVSLPAPISGLRVTGLAEQGAIAALPVTHRHAVEPHLRLERIAPERLVVLPREIDRAFFDAVLVACRAAGVSPTLIEIPGGSIEHALVAVASGAGLALLPEFVAQRFTAPGVRFLPLAGERLVIPIALATRRNTDHLPTAALLRALRSLPTQTPPVEPGCRLDRSSPQERPRLAHQLTHTTRSAMLK